MLKDKARRAERYKTSDKIHLRRACMGFLTFSVSDAFFNLCQSLNLTVALNIFADPELGKKFQEIENQILEFWEVNRAGFEPATHSLEVYSHFNV